MLTFPVRFVVTLSLCTPSSSSIITPSIAHRPHPNAAVPHNDKAGAMDDGGVSIPPPCFLAARRPGARRFRQQLSSTVAPLTLTLLTRRPPSLACHRAPHPLTGHCRDRWHWTTSPPAQRPPVTSLCSIAAWYAPTPEIDGRPFPRPPARPPTPLPRLTSPVDRAVGIDLAGFGELPVGVHWPDATEATPVYCQAM